MVITYYGGLCIKVQSGETVFVFNPPSKKSKLKSPRFQSDVVLINYNTDDYNGWDNMPGKIEGKNPVVIDGPGEYEIKGIHINGKMQGLNSVFNFSIEDVFISHLGNFQEKGLSAEIQESASNVDILFVPIGGESTLDPEESAKICVQLEPKIIIPLYDFNDGKEKGNLQKFLKVMGSESGEQNDKLTIKKKDLVDKESAVVVLKPCLS